VLNDNDPYTGGTNQNTPLHLNNLLSQAGKTWKSYQEDIDLARNDAGQLINVPLSQDQWSVPLTSFSGTFGSNSVNDWNGGIQYNYATKHNPMVFFSDTTVETTRPRLTRCLSNTRRCSSC